MIQDQEQELRMIKEYGININRNTRTSKNRFEDREKNIFKELNIKEVL